MRDTRIKLIVHNIRSCLNVGSFLRTAEGLGIDEVILSGYTPYPAMKSDKRLPHVARSVDRRIHTSALGAESFISWRHTPDWKPLPALLKSQGFTLIALEQTAGAIALPEFQCPLNVALVVGREVEGLEDYVLKDAEYAVSIPMLGKKESYNVAQAAAMAMYHCRFG